MRDAAKDAKRGESDSLLALSASERLHRAQAGAASRSEDTLRHYLKCSIGATPAPEQELGAGQAEVSAHLPPKRDWADPLTLCDERGTFY